MSLVRRLLCRLSLRFYYTVAFIVFALATLAATGAALLWLTGQRLEEQAYERTVRGAQTARRLLDERLLRMASDAEAVSLRPDVRQAVEGRDPAALAEVATALQRTYGGFVALTDEGGRTLAVRPDVTAALDGVPAVQAALRSLPASRRRGIEPLPHRQAPFPGWLVAQPVTPRSGEPQGTVVMWRALDDGAMNDVASVTGLHIAIFTWDQVLAASRDVRELLTPPRGRPTGQRLAPITRRQILSGQAFVAIGYALRGTAAPQPYLGTLFVGLPESEVLSVTRLNKLALGGLLGGTLLVALVLGELCARTVTGPLARWHRAAGALAAQARGEAGERWAGDAGGSSREVHRTGEALAHAANEISGALSEVTQQAEERRLVIDGMADGVVGLDREGRTVVANAAAGRLLRVPILSSGTRLRDQVSEENWRALEPLAMGAGQAATDITLSGPERVILRVAAAPAHGGPGDRLARVVVLHDATAERLLDSVKEDFFTVVSHELRTPLSAVKGAAELLRDEGELTTTQGRLLDTIERNSQRLIRLVTDLLDISRLESGKLELAARRLDLVEIAADAAAAMEPVARREGIELTVETNAETLPVLGDASRIEQILVELLSNACQHTPRGGHIRVSTWAAEGFGCVSVTDDGAGISAVDQLHLFDRFYQGVSSPTRQRGSGLGLTIAKHLAELHGGRLTVRSKLREGSSFTLSVPLLGATGAADPSPLSGVGAAGGR